jgi:hypothetical protein
MIMRAAGTPRLLGRETGKEGGNTAINVINFQAIVILKILIIAHIFARFGEFKILSYHEKAYQLLRSLNPFTEEKFKAS